MTDDSHERRIAGIPAQLRQHARECDDCRAAPLPLENIAAALSEESRLDLEALSFQVMVRLRPELERRAAAASRRRLLIALLLSLLPLPLVVAFDAAFLAVVYEVAQALVPGGVAAYAVLSYGAFLLLLFASTYAAVPVLMEKGGISPRPAIG